MTDTNAFGRRLALCILALSVLSAALIIFTPMKILLTCDAPWECHYFSFKSPTPWLFIEEPLSVAAKYAFIFLPLFYFLRQLQFSAKAERLFWHVLSLYGIEFLADTFIAITLLLAITSVKYFVLFLPYIVYAIQGFLLAHWYRRTVSLSIFPMASAFFVSILLSTLAYSYIYRYLVNIYARSVGAI